MAEVAQWASSRLQAVGYTVVRQGFPFTRYAVDYAAGHEPVVERDDGARFKTDSAFNLGATTGAEGISCTVRKTLDVQAGDCGFIPFERASPEWKNEPFRDPSTGVREIVTRGGVAAVIQGDVRRDVVFAQSVRSTIPAVVSVVHASEVVGRRVRLRAMGGFTQATGHNVIGFRRGSTSTFVMLLAHADGWYQAAADNGSGVAGVMRAAELLAGEDLGVVIALVDAEEIGLLGSKYLAESLDNGLDLGDGGPPLRIADIRGIVNLDASTARASDVQDTVRGIARTDAPFFMWRAMVFSEPLGPQFLARFASHGVLGLPAPARVWVPAFGYRTDVQWFAERGVPFVWPVAGYPEYHTDGDTLGTVDLSDLEAVTQAGAELARDL